MNRKILLPFAFLAVLSAPAYAADGMNLTGFFAGASIGQSSFDLDTAGGRSVSDDSDSGGKIFIGYQFMPAFGLEAGWVDLGKASLNGGGEHEAKDGFFFDLVGTLPINNNAALFAKIGGYSIKSKLSTPTVNIEDRNADWKWGVGGTWMFDKNWGARIEWERFAKVGESGTGEGDIDLLSIGVSYKF